MKHFLFDIVAILAFAIFARMAHKSEPFTALNVLNTWWPFAVGVCVAWGFFALSKRQGASLASGVIVWACTVFAGLGHWAVEHGRAPHYSFIIVATVMSGLLLLGWRGIDRVVSRSGRSLDS